VLDFSRIILVERIMLTPVPVVVVVVVVVAIIITI